MISATISDSGSSGRSNTSNKLMAPERTSFMSPAKRRSGKPLSSEKKVQTKLSNRFDCLKEVNSLETMRQFRFE